MSGEKFEGQDAGYVPENLENIENLDFPPTLPDEHDEHDEHGEGNVIDETGFPQLQPDELDDEGNLDEEADLPENKFDGQDVEDLALSEDAVAPLQEQMEEEEEEHHDEGVAAVAAESFGSLEKQGAEDDLKSAEIKKWPGWPGENVFRMLVPAQKVGSVIGRKGEFIKKITEETKARIKVLDGPPGTAERAVMVSAKEEPDRDIPPAVEGLLRVHKQIVNVDHDSSDSASGAGNSVVTRLLVADTQAGSLIGKQGSTIKSIQDATGCNIRVLGAEHLPVFALRDDSLVEIQGEPAGIHKTVELIALHLRKFLVDRSIVGVFETQMQRPNARPTHNAPPPLHWGPPPQGFAAPRPGGGPGFAPNPQYMPPPSHNYDSYYPPADFPPMEKHLQGPPPAYARDTSMGMNSSGAQLQQSVGSKATQHMQIPLTYADAVIGASGANISYIRRASGANVTIQETRGVPGEMTVEINGTASQIQAAQQLVQNFMAEAASAAQAQDPMGGAINQGYNSSYPSNAPVYASPPSSDAGHTGHVPSADYGPVYGANYGY